MHSIPIIWNENITVSYTNHILPCHINNHINGERLAWEIAVQHFGRWISSQIALARNYSEEDANS